MVAFHGVTSYRIAGILPASSLKERWSPDRQSLSFLPAVRLPMPPEMVAFHCVTSYRIAGILPALFLKERWSPDRL
jgi:hypothetical protein